MSYFYIYGSENGLNFYKNVANQNPETFFPLKSKSDILTLFTSDPDKNP